MNRASALKLMKLNGQINHDKGTTFLISTDDEKITTCRTLQIQMGDTQVTG